MNRRKVDRRKRDRVRFLLSILNIILWIAVILATLNAEAHGDTRGRARMRQSQKQMVFFENPITYVFGVIEDGGIYKVKETVVTRIRIQPYGANMIFDRVYDFCGNEGVSFRGKGTFVVISYDRVIHKDNCNDILSVHRVDGNPEDGSPLQLP